MATYSPTTIAGTTDVYEYTIGFSYARVDDVKVYIDDVEISRGSGAGKFQFSSSGTKVIFEDGSEPQTGETLVIKRVTDISDASVVYSAGSGFVHPDINLALNQLLYAVDELQVPAFEKEFTLTALAADDVTTPHNLGAVPTRMVMVYECTTNDLGYEVGDFLFNGAPTGTYWDDTNVTTSSAVFDSIATHNRSTGIVETMTTGNWTIRIQAWR